MRLDGIRLFSPNLLKEDLIQLDDSAPLMPRRFSKIQGDVALLKEGSPCNLGLKANSVHGLSSLIFTPSAPMVVSGNNSLCNRGRQRAARAFAGGDHRPAP